MEEIENVVFEGGGICGLASSGALLTLSKAEQLSKVKRAGGTSAGAILAMMYAIGFSPREIYDISAKLDFGKMITGNVVTEAESLATDWGLHDGHKFLQFFQDCVKEKLGNPKATFEDLHNKREQELREKGTTNFLDLYVVVTNLSRKSVAVMSFENRRYAKLPIALGVRMSMAIPGYFTPIRLSGGKGAPTETFVDGGYYENYFLDLFDLDKYITPDSTTPNQVKFNPKTIGFRLDSGSDFQRFEEHREIVTSIDSLPQYFKQIAENYLNAQKLHHRSPRDQDRSVISNVGTISAIDFNLSTSDRKNHLIVPGEEAGQAFLSKHGITPPPTEDQIAAVRSPSPIPDTGGADERKAEMIEAKTAVLPSDTVDNSTTSAPTSEKQSTCTIM